MIKREVKLVITFRTTTEAMAMESCCKAEGAPGRLIPVPASISAGCGMAWSAKPECKELLLELMERNHITPQAMQECIV